MGDIQPTSEDLARDLRADLARSVLTAGQLWEWGEEDDRDWMKAASVGWSAAIRRAIHAEQMQAELSAEVIRLQGIIDGLREALQDVVEIFHGCGDAKGMMQAARDALRKAPKAKTDDAATGDAVLALRDRALRGGGA